MPSSTQIYPLSLHDALPISIPASGQVPGLALVPDSRVDVYGLLLLAVAVVVAYWFLIERTRFGFELRAAGQNEAAAVASGVDVRSEEHTSELQSRRDLVCRLPHRSTLFPYTTLFRSRSRPRARCPAWRWCPTPGSTSTVCCCWPSRSWSPTGS